MYSEASMEIEMQETGTLKQGSAEKRPPATIRPHSELGNAFLLVVLYMVQGVPLGLSMGSMPFLMRSTMSYTKIGIFTLAAYPYSFKLLWSPIVDTFYSKTIGRRKSWILPLQTLSAAIMIFSGRWVEVKLQEADAVAITALFFVLVLLAATQDIAVDGWALTLLSKKNVGYAATCQTIGMNIGYFSSFTVFLALSDAEFCSSYLGTAAGVAVITLSGYMRFWGYAYLVVTAAVTVFKKEGIMMGSGVNFSTEIEKKSEELLFRNQIVGNKSGGATVTKGSLRTPACRRSQRLASLVSPTTTDHVVLPFESIQSPFKSTQSGHHGLHTRSHSRRLTAAATLSPVHSRRTEDNDEDDAANGGVAHTHSDEHVRLMSSSPPPPPSTLVEASTESSNEDDDDDVREAYAQLWRVVSLPSVRLLAVLLMIARLGMLAAESAAPLKLLEKGVGKEALAGLVLIEFPVELVSALVAGRWAASSHPLRPYFSGYRLRLALAAATTAAVYFFPPGAASLSDAPVAFGVLAVIGVLTSFASTLMFTALGDFFNRISDPAMGGAYLTLLNTLANVGVVVPKLAVFALMDVLTARKCFSINGDGSSSSSRVSAVCGPASAGGTADRECTAAGGTCVIVRDGFYVLAIGSGVVGVGIGVWMHRALKKLEGVPPAEWRAPLLVNESGGGSTQQLQQKKKKKQKY